MRGYLVDCGPCPYLADRRFHAFQPLPDTDRPEYRLLMDHRFRRSGSFLYAPQCPGCDECRPIRVDVDAFAPRRDQRRCQTRNRDLELRWSERGLDDERMDLYRRYQAQIHGVSSDRDSASSLVEDGGQPGGELHARDASGRLLAVSIVDRFTDALSSVYCYYDPDYSWRSLGTFMVLSEIAWCKSADMRWLYLGFHVAHSPKMAYKARFHPHQILVSGSWQTVTAPA